jgi:hypothetical protein
MATNNATDNAGGSSPVSVTFTPTLIPGSGSFTTITYGSQSGEYVQLGNVVWFSIAISLTAFVVGTATGSNLLIGTVPALGGTTIPQCSILLSNVTFVGSPTAQANGTNFVIIQSVSGTGGTPITCDKLTSSSIIRLSGLYFTS